MRLYIYNDHSAEDAGVTKHGAEIRRVGSSLGSRRSSSDTGAHPRRAGAPMTLSRRGFVNVGGDPKLPMPYGFAAMSPPYVRGLLDQFAAEPPIRERTFYKSASLGPTVGILENAIGYAIDELGREQQVAAHAFDDVNCEGEHQWSPKESNPIDDINAAWAWLTSPGYQVALDAQRRAYIAEMKRRASHIAELSALIRTPGPRPDLIVIDGIGYGKDDPLPPPFGSGA